jgi:hypothetical protein|tara:strand:- start:1249 stop:1440 length:192 start_codon:yes stop_codon:yes gene_type:complete
MGELIQASYDFEITHCFIDSDRAKVFYGIVIDWKNFSHGNYFYQILCTDGDTRFFTEWEIKKV